MRKLLCTALILLFPMHAPTAAASSPAVPPLRIENRGAHSEAFLEFSSNLDCGGPDSAGLPGFRGNVRFSNDPRKQLVLFNLFQGKPVTRVALGPADTERELEVHLKPFKDSDCQVRAFDARVVYEDTSRATNEPEDAEYLLALRHSPYLVIREDQYANHETDLPLELAYSTTRDEAARTLTIRYTAFFSDEDSKTSSKDLEGQFARYGRTTDVEWIYEVTLAEFGAGAARDSRYQGTLFGKLRSGELAGDHSSQPMQGAYWERSSHPILYNVANNNVFSDKPDTHRQESSYAAYHLGLSPANRIKRPHARERFQFSDAGRYMFLVSEIEERRENKLPSPVKDQLFFMVRGKLSDQGTALNLRNGAFGIKVALQDSAGVTQGEWSSAKSVDRLGEDLFGRESFAAVAIGQSRLLQLERGELSATLTFEDRRFAGRTKELSLKALEPFRMSWNPSSGRYEPIRLTAKPGAGEKLGDFGKKIQLAP